MQIIDSVRLDNRLHITISMERDMSDIKTQFDEDLLPIIDKFRGCKLEITGNPYFKVTIDILGGSPSEE